MGRTPALKAAQKKYRESRKRIEVMTGIEEYGAIQAAAAAAGMSANAYILQAVREKMSREGAADEKAEAPDKSEAPA